MSKLEKKIFNKKKIKIEIPLESTFFFEDRDFRIEIPLGSNLVIDNHKIGVVEDIDGVCDDCIFYMNVNCQNFKCIKRLRTDYTDVKFILFEQ